MFKGDGTTSDPLEFDVKNITDHYKIASTVSYKLDTNSPLVSYYDTDANKIMPG